LVDWRRPIGRRRGGRIDGVRVLRALLASRGCTGIGVDWCRDSLTRRNLWLRQFDRLARARSPSTTVSVDGWCRHVDGRTRPLRTIATIRTVAAHTDRDTARECHTYQYGTNRDRTCHPSDRSEPSTS
jgi:hypothetical protein